MFDHILVPVDGSEFGWAALDEALEIARDAGATIHALYIIEKRLLEGPWVIGISERSAEGDEGQTTKAAIQQRLQEHGRQVLEEAKSRCEAQGIPCETEMAEGRVSHIILERAKNVQLLAMGRRGLGARWGGLLLGSTFEALVRHAPVPVLSVGKEARPLRRLLVAYSGTRRSDEALDIAIWLAQAGNREVILLTVEEEHENRAEAFNRARERLQEAGIRFHSFLRVGHVPQVILDTADEEGVDLILMGAYGRGELVDRLFGCTVDEVMRKTTLPLLVCR